jgi:molybdate transport system substrate-binding protein
MSHRNVGRLLLGCLLAALGCGCKRSTPPPAPVEQHDLTVFAAASLREALTALGHNFEETHPGTHVILSFAGSQTLRAQIEHGAPADVFASADERHMKALYTEGLVKEPRLFATNELVVAVARARADTLREFRQLPEAARIVLGAPEVPVGEYTRKMLERASGELGADFAARVEAHVVSREPDVRQVLAKLSLGEADAGVVYRTDALSAKDKIVVVDVPAAYNVVASYPIAVTAHGKEPDIATAFIQLLLSPDGARSLSAQGFLPPNSPSAAVH